jgi:CheY-like chemotaxis protein
MLAAHRKRRTKVAAATSPTRVRLASVSGQTLEGRLVHPGGRYGPGGRSVHDGGGTAVELLLPSSRGDHYIALLDLESVRDLGPRRRALQVGERGAYALPVRQVQRLLAWARDPGREPDVEQDLHALVAADEERGAKLGGALEHLDLIVDSVVEDGYRALRATRLRLPDLVVCTSRLHGLDGYQLVRRFRARSADTRIVLIQDDGEDPERARNAGADAAIGWPSEADRVARFVRQLLELV